MYTRPIKRLVQLRTILEASGKLDIQFPEIVAVDGQFFFLAWLVQDYDSREYIFQWYIYSRPVARDLVAKLLSRREDETAIVFARAARIADEKSFDDIFMRVNKYLCIISWRRDGNR